MKTEHILLLVGGFLLWQHMQKQQSPQQIVIREGGGGGQPKDDDEYGWKDAIDDAKDLFEIGLKFWEKYNEGPEYEAGIV